MSEPTLPSTLPIREEYLRENIQVIQKCAICWGPFTETHYPAKLSGPTGCSHVFGHECLLEQLNSNVHGCHRCSICRAELFQPVIDDDTEEEDGLYDNEPSDYEVENEFISLLHSDD